MSRERGFGYGRVLSGADVEGGAADAHTADRRYAWAAAKRYGLALACVGGAVLLRWALHPWLGEHASLIALGGGVAVAVWLAGAPPAALAALAGYLASHLLLIEPGTVSQTQLIAGFAVYATSCALIIAIGARLRRLQARARADAEALAASERRLRLAQRAAGTAAWEWDPVSGNAYWTPETHEFFGIDREQPDPIALWRERIHPEDRVRSTDGLARFLASGASGEFEFRYAHPKLGERWILSKAGVIEEGGRRLLAGISIDVTDRKRSEEHRELLLRELSHRVKNTLAVVQSIASQTLRRSDSLERFRASFTGRLDALAGAHDLMLQHGGWSEVDLRELMRRTVAPIAHSDRIWLEGEPVRLSANAAVSLGMAVHELATNASKYGALSTPTGVVEIDWGIGEEPGAPLVIQWKENGGPPVEAPQDARGFGSRLIEQVARELGARVERDWRVAGFVCRLAIPVGVHVHRAADE